LTIGLKCLIGQRGERIWRSTSFLTEYPDPAEKSICFRVPNLSEIVTDELLGK
jgi:hypothetical protein